MKKVLMQCFDQGYIFLEFKIHQNAVESVKVTNNYKHSPSIFSQVNITKFWSDKIDHNPNF